MKTTICIPHVMRGKMLEKCLNSIKDNVKIPHKILVVNSGFPLSLSGIQIVNDKRLHGLGAKRAKFEELTKTEYMTTLDNDMLVSPGSIGLQIKSLEENPSLGVVSGLFSEHGKLKGQVADFVIGKRTISREVYDINTILNHKDELFKADYVPIGIATFRMKVFDCIHMDPTFQFYYEHLDTFLQLFHTPWECAVHREATFAHLKWDSPREYIQFKKINSLEQDKRYFIEKWGREPV